MLTYERVRSVLFGSLLATSLATAATLCAADREPGSPGVVTAEFIYQTAPFPQCHASTIAETREGLIAAWFGGKHEKHPEVAIWTARQVAGKWTAPVPVADGIQNAQLRHPCWNPVLFQMPDGPLLLFYKVGPSPKTWWGMLLTSADGGRSWGPPARLPKEILGPIKNKPLLLADGRLLCGSSSEHDGWRVHLEWTRDRGQNWERTAALNDGTEVGAIQPTILRHRDGRLQILCRSQGGWKILQAFSADGGKTWAPWRPASCLIPMPESTPSRWPMAGRSWSTTTRPPAAAR